MKYPYLHTLLKHYEFKIEHDEDCITAYRSDRCILISWCGCALPELFITIHVKADTVASCWVQMTNKYAMDEIAGFINKEITMPEPDEFEYTGDIDASLLGLKYEFIAFLEENGFSQYYEYSEIEVDLSNKEIKICLKCPYKQIKNAIKTFTNQEGFPKVIYVADRNAVYLMRK